MNYTVLGVHPIPLDGTKRIGDLFVDGEIQRSHVCSVWTIVEYSQHPLPDFVELTHKKDRTFHTKSRNDVVAVTVHPSSINKTAVDICSLRMPFRDLSLYSQRSAGDLCLNSLLV